MVNDPLVVILGIGKYYGLKNLAGVPKDYTNIINTFGKYWRYKILYKLSDNTLVYSNDIKKLKKKSNYKLKWTLNDVDELIQEARHFVVTNKHSGLIFVASGHGDKNKVLYSSNCNKIELKSIFASFSEEASSFFNLYKETRQQSNHLFSIPKIFLIDICRGNAKAKVTTIEDCKVDSDADVVSRRYRSIPNNCSVKPQPEKLQLQDPHSSNNSISTNTVATKLKQMKERPGENISLKAVGKEEAKKLAAQMGNFYKLGVVQK